MKKVGLIMGSDSDLPVVQKAAAVLKELGIPYEAHVYSAHRTPAEARDWTLAARSEGFGVIIAFAGMAAHLAGAIAANTTLPVIGVPCRGAALDGMDALLSTVMMPSGIPVATVAIDGGKNAALLAAAPKCSRCRTTIWLQRSTPAARRKRKLYLRRTPASVTDCNIHTA